MTKKRIGTKRRRRVKKQMRRKSRKMRKSMRGGNRQFVQKIIRCIPQDPVNYPNIPISLSGYQNNDDDWTKLAKNIYENRPIEFQCDEKDSQIYGINLDINFDTGIKKGELYGKIGESIPILLWRNGRQQTYQAPSTVNRAPFLEAIVTPPRVTANGPPPIDRNARTATNQGMSPPGSPGVTRSLFNDENSDDNGPYRQQ